MYWNIIGRGDCRPVVKICYETLRFLFFAAYGHQSDGIRQSPRGESVTVPTFGPSGRQERLNCCVKKRRIKVVSHS